MRALQALESTVFVGLRCSAGSPEGAAASNAASNVRTPPHPWTPRDAPVDACQRVTPVRFPDVGPIRSKGLAQQSPPGLGYAIGEEDVMPDHLSAAHPADAECVLLTPEQAARRLGISRWKRNGLLRKGALPSLRIGSCPSDTRPSDRGLRRHAAARPVGFSGQTRQNGHEARQWRRQHPPKGTCRGPSGDVGVDQGGLAVHGDRLGEADVDRDQSGEPPRALLTERAQWEARR